MIKDKNGNVIEIGDIVKIENSPIKNDNAVYVVEQDGTSKLYSGSDLTLYRVARHKGGYTLSKSSNSTCFYPLVNFSNRYKFTREEMRKATIVILAKNNPKAFELKKCNDVYESEENADESYYSAVLEVSGEQINDTSYSCDQSEKLISFFSNLNFKQGEELIIRKANRTWGYWYQREPSTYVFIEREKHIHM